MKQETKAEKAERLLAASKKERGYIFEEWEFICRRDPDFFEAYNNLYGAALGRKKVLEIKVKEFVAIAVLCHRGSSIESITSHMGRAMRYGATTDELVEVVESTIGVGGAPTFRRGLMALVALEKAKEAKAGKQAE